MTGPVLRGMATRSLESRLVRRVAEEPVIILNGPRTVGKSTLLAALATRLGAPILDLDDLATRQAVATDPALFVSRPGPVLIDEFQHVPELLDAIKAELNRDLRPGRFILTGSTRYDSLPLIAQSLTGRAHLMAVWPLSLGEVTGVEGGFLTALVGDPATLVTSEPSTTTRQQYVASVLSGGFPLALSREPGDARSRWFADYVELVLRRDVLGIRQIRRMEQLPTLLRHLAARTAQPLNISEAGSRAGLANDVTQDYTRLLESVYLLHRLPAWGTTLGSRVARHPKVHLVDTGVGGWLLGMSEDKLASLDPSSLTDFGHLLESFAVNEVLKQASWSEEAIAFGHHRTHDGLEVDLVLERRNGDVLALEVKAGSRVLSSQLAGLRSLRTKLGSRFRGGVVLHTGAHAYTAEDRIHVIPLDTVWR